ncbi:DNA polymerase III subunit delta [Paenibacillus dendritiformis]|uniref:DNA polymerase III subunit delta n=1 Tax=Paenibacillus dendritiformis TaxID=130049 RepID=UPI0018CEB071|nr:DNA polymerase III subunit delta [Paenibacillus dendritiformis]MBG9792061.1 DNA polymerase III subunit delta [Paenibacillus dendritiformis]
MDMKAAIKEIQRGEPRPIYVLYGTEKYRMQEFVQYLLEHVFEPENRELAIMKMDTAEAPIEAVIEEAETLPFLVPRKCILVKDHSIFASGKDKMEHRTERLLEYMEQPMETSIIIFLVQADKLDERKKTVKTAKAKAAVLAFQPLGAEELAQWVKRETGKHGCSIGEEAVTALLNAVGTNLQALAGEIEKCCLFAGEGGVIDTATVEGLIPKNTEQNVFQLVEDVVRHRAGKALGTLHELLKQKEEPIKILALIVRQLRMMLQVKELTNQSFTQQQAASQLGIHPYAAKMAAEQARAYGTDVLAGWLAEAAELDYEMKSGRVDKTLGLEMFIMRMAAGRTRSGMAGSR